MIYIIDDDRDFAECIARVVRAFSEAETKIFRNGIEAMAALDEGVPDLIFLDVLLDGPDGFTFLNELMSYGDTEKIPVVIVSSLDFAEQDLSEYGVVAKLNKAEMTPKDIEKVVRGYAG